MHDPFDIGGYTPVSSPSHLGVELQFEGTEGRACTILASDLVCAFLEMCSDGLLPEVTPEWIERVVGPEAVRAEGAVEHVASYGGLRRVVQAMCECCGEECHAIFVKDGLEYPIERWSVMSAVLALVAANCLPDLPFQWHVEMERNYERICETGRRHWQGHTCGAADV